MMKHTVHAVVVDDHDWEMVIWHVKCPFEATNRYRDCRLADPEYGDECGVQHWLDAGGPEAIRVEGSTGKRVPFSGTVEWDDDGPILVVERVPAAGPSLAPGW